MPCPDRFLVLARQRLQRQPLLADRGHRAVQVTVGAQHVGEQRGVAGVGLSPGLGVSLPIAGHGARVQRVHGEPGSNERDNEQVLVGLDADRGLLGRTAVLGDQREQLGETGDAGVDPGLADDGAGLVHDSDVVMPLSPVDADGDRCHPLLLVPSTRSDGRTGDEHRDEHGDLMEALNGAASHKPMIWSRATGRATVYVEKPRHGRALMKHR